MSTVPKNENNHIYWCLSCCGIYYLVFIYPDSNFKLLFFARESNNTKVLIGEGPASVKTYVEVYLAETVP